MLIGVDAGCLGIKDERLKAGVYQVAKNLLIELGKKDKNNFYYLYSFFPIEKDLMKQFGDKMKNIIVKPSKGWLKIWLPFRLSIDRPDIFLGLSQSLPIFSLINKNIKKISVIHDVAYEIYPEFYKGSVDKMRNNIKNVLNDSDTIICVSNFTKNDLVKFYNAQRKNIIVIYPGYDKNLFKINKTENKKENYFLFAGSLKKIKNVPIIIKAFTYFSDKTKKDFKLYIAGGDKWIDEEIDKTINNLKPKAKEKIKLLGFVEENHLLKLYENATAFVSPSLCEGFGITFLEAMSMGCPVITSNAGSIPEVIGDAGILVNPKDYKNLATALLKLSSNDKLRRDLIKKGFERVEKYSWEKFAEKILILINS